MSICRSCRAWLKDFFEQIIPPTSISETTVVIERTSDRDYRDFKSGRSCCWFCHRISVCWLIGFPSQEPLSISLRLKMFISLECKCKPLAILNINFMGSTPGMTIPVSLVASLNGRGSEQIHSEEEKRSWIHSFGQALKNAIVTFPNTSADHRATTVQDNISLLTNWLRKCNDKHITCCPLPGQSDQLPNRLLRISRDRDDEPVQIKLVETLDEARELGSTIKYATLSHCWGPDPFLTLNTDNYNAFLGSVPFDKLTRTFQESISLCLQLRINYIWIDSLCIIQDDSSDWLIEARLMQQVYQNSYLNIAAVASTAGAQGLYREQNFHIASKITLGSSESDLRLASGQQSAILEKELRTMPLLSRGWVIQELALAPRTVHWGASELIWCCRSLAESGGYGPQRDNNVSDVETSGSVFNGGPHTLPTSMMTAPAKSWKELNIRWNNLVSTYVSQDWTYMKDKYYALSGLAKAFRGEYYRCGITTSCVAGLWTHTMPCSLLWHETLADIQCSPAPIRSQQAPHFPSWTWLRPFRRPVYGGSWPFSEQIITKLLDCQSIDITADDFTDELIKLSYLKLQGPVIRLARPGTDYTLTDRSQSAVRVDRGIDTFVEGDERDLRQREAKHAMNERRYIFPDRDTGGEETVRQTAKLRRHETHGMALCYFYWDQDSRNGLCELPSVPWETAILIHRLQNHLYEGLCLAPITEDDRANYKDVLGSEDFMSHRILYKRVGYVMIDVDLDSRQINTGSNDTEQVEERLHDQNAGPNLDHESFHQTIIIV